jgi:hypothetical protein
MSESKAIEIRLLSDSETFAYAVKGIVHCTVTGCVDDHRHLAVWQRAARVHRALLCDHHGAAWAAKHHQTLPVAEVS